jgi:hypothetical protein
MFPTKLELDVLYAERLREAEHHRMLRRIGTPSPFERIRARLFPVKAPAPAQAAPMVVRQAPRCDVPAISQ